MNLVKYFIGNHSDGPTKYFVGMYSVGKFIIGIIICWNHTYLELYLKYISGKIGFNDIYISVL